VTDFNRGMFDAVTIHFCAKKSKWADPQDARIHPFGAQQFDPPPARRSWSVAPVPTATDAIWNRAPITLFSQHVPQHLAAGGFTRQGSVR
jgi:hypothetical protein